MRGTLLLILAMPTLAAAQRAVEGNRIISKAFPAAVLEIAEGMTYAGTQSFDLYDVANAEQHFYVERDGDRVKRMLWIQFEGYKPDNSKSYNYPDPILRHSGQAWHWRVGPFHLPEAEARPESDGARARAFIKAKGWTLGPDVAMERLVWIVDLPARNELMIIYMEDLADHGLTAADLRVGGKAVDRWPRFASELQQRALASFAVSSEQ
ncbi:MAG TPA: hypothetical protein VJU15_07355 [Gemmatimonadales bacterium]|nr:hypothetical protein [Gemmatimonadales bacterium]